MIHVDHKAARYQLGKNHFPSQLSLTPVGPMASLFDGPEQLRVGEQY
jgi:hypothetical protein